jgi:hypothetical protein
MAPLHPEYAELHSISITEAKLAIPYGPTVQNLPSKARVSAVPVSELGL